MTNLMVVGEAWGEQEERERTAFVGASGYELTRMLGEAGIHRADCFLTNVFNLRPNLANDVLGLCGPRATGLIGYPALAKSSYVRAEFGPELERLQHELITINPNLVLALGNTALWALCGVTGISKRRGTIFTSTHTVSGFKVLPTYHPAAVIRSWDLRPVTVLDFRKAARQREFPEIVWPERQIWIEPTLDDLELFYNNYLLACSSCSVDIETAGTQITCLGFAPSPKVALVVPFTDPRKSRGSYWPTLSDELVAWNFVKRALDLPCKKIFQNGLYDLGFMWRSYGIKARNPAEDTMLAHHALQPESPKGLDFLASVYCSDRAWKLIRPRGKHTIKREE